MLGRLIFASATPVRIQSFVQRLMGGPRLVTVRFRNGHLFDCFTSEKYYWFRDLYEDEVRRKLEACLTPDSVLFDVGAHVGFWEVLLAWRCRHIHAFEPSPRNFIRLSRNITQNQIENVTLVPAAISDQTGKLHFVENGSMSHIGETGIEVDAIRLDDYVAQHEPPTVVKMDIEGNAGAALSGMRRTLARFEPMLLLELHSAFEVAACCAALEELPYKFSPLGRRIRFPHHSMATAD